MAPIRVLLVERERAVAQAVAFSLAGDDEFLVVGSAQSVTAAEAESAEHSPDVVVLDEAVARGKLAGVVSRLRMANTGVRIVVTGPAEDLQTAYESVRAGASAFVSKGAGLDEMIRAVRGAARGETWIPPALLTGVLRQLQEQTTSDRSDALRIARLSARERQVLECMMTGADRARIARELVLSINTVRTHTQNILSKLEVHSSLEAVSLAVHAGLGDRPGPGGFVPRR
jgi:DNA-binding NarL/FixJ family response regulator